MRPVGWDALGQWGAGAARIEPLTGGVANDVWLVRVGGEVAVGRLGGRSDADLAWETGLMLHLDGAGLTVPVPIPTTDGRLFADGAYDIAAQASAAWEAAVCWDDEYAVRRLAEVRAA